MKESLALRITEANAGILVDGNIDAIPEFFAPDYVAHVTKDDMTGGHDAIRRMVQRWRRAFLDLSAEVEILIEGPGPDSLAKDASRNPQGRVHGLSRHRAEARVARHGHESLPGWPHRGGLGHHGPGRTAFAGTETMSPRAYR